MDNKFCETGFLLEYAKICMALGVSPKYWNADYAKEHGIKLARNQHYYKVRNGKILTFKSPSMIKKEREELAPF